MQNPNTDDLGDLSLDEFFPNPENVTDPNASTATTASASATAATPGTTSDEPFLKTTTGTVYKSAEDAVRGVEHKDALIQKLRQEAIDRTGIDPMTQQPVRRQDIPVNYTQDGERFLTDLAAAAKKGDPSAYVKVQEKLVQDVLAPYAPVITGFAKAQAVDKVASEFSDFRTFNGSSDYAAVLDENPMLREAIQIAENNPGASSQLTDFYKMAYKLNTARKLPEAVRAQTALPTTARPTVSSTNPTAHPSTTRTAIPTLGSREGRQAVIAEQERLGVENLRF